MKHPISYQLYSSRNFGPMDNTMAMLASAGYSQVEGYGALFDSTEAAFQIKQALVANNLTMPTAHMGLQNLEAAPEMCVEVANILDLKAVYVPYLDQESRPADAEGWRAMGQRAQTALLPLIEAGLDVGWHNHDFEMADLGQGQLVIDALLEGGPSLKLELDLAWVIVGGQDPVKLLSSYKDRISSVHIKDIAPAGEKADEDGWADVGDGTVDWQAIKNAVSETTNKYLIVEHDNPSDDVRFANASISTVNKIWNN